MFLNSAARAIVERRLHDGGDWLFPSPKVAGRPVGGDLPLWYRVRKQAGLDDVRPHDVRRTFASHAVMRGVPLPVVARLLGHSRTAMTLRYAHTGDAETAAAAERIGVVMAGWLGEPAAD